MTDQPVPQPSGAELRMRPVAYRWFARRGLRVLEGDVNLLIHQMETAGHPGARPPEREPSEPRGAAARSAARKALKAPPVVPPAAATVAAPPKPEMPAAPPEPNPKLLARITVTDRQIVALIGQGLSNLVIGERVGLDSEQVRQKIRRLRGLLGEDERAALPGAAKRAGILGVAVPGAATAAVCPPAALDRPMRARGASAADRPAEGPSGAFPTRADARVAQEAPESASGAPRGGLAWRSGPSGPPRLAEARTEPYGASGPQAASQAVAR